MPASGRFPVETWQIILRYTISVPVFFSTDPIESYGMEEFITSYDKDSIYWKSERQRSVLRRVCLSWNIYLHRFNHRYVKLDDVINGHVPVHAISQAIRFNHNYNHEHPDSVFSAQIIEEAICYGPEEWPLEILQGVETGLNEMILRGRKAIGLKSIIGSELDLQDVMQSAPRLSLLHLPSRPADNVVFRNMVNLTTLSLKLLSLDVIRTWNVPNLQHFSFLAYEMSSSEFIQALQTIGKNLLTLYDTSYACYESFPDRTWSLCPNLKQLETSFVWPSNTTIPHTLQSVRLRLQNYPELDNSVRFPAKALGNAGIGTAKFVGRWYEAIFEFMGFGQYLVFAMNNGIALLDEEGVLFETFLVATLKYYWKGRRRVVPRIVLPSYNFLF